MADNTNPNASKNISANLLPRIYRTDANKKFLQATLEQLIQPGNVKKINGYIGRQNAKATTGDDIFIKAVDTDRQNYQLEPGLVVKDTLDNTTFFKDYQDYINQISVFGGNVSNHARLNNQESYSWDPHIDWDKFVNFQNYYWLPYGPDVIKIYGQKEAIVSTYVVTVESQGDSNEYLFTPNGLTRNPTLTLFKGQTYKFEINSPGNPFSFKTRRSSGNADLYQNYGLDKSSVENGTITFTIPHDAPTVLYYQSENDTDLGGVIHVLAIEDNSHIDVETAILGKKTYQLADGTALSNGMKVSFGGIVTPNSYAIGSYYVEGVGSAIKLVNEKVLELVSAYTSSEAILFDSTPFDKSPFSDATAFAGSPDYVVINRSSKDTNPWSRYNRWFHKDMIETSAKFTGNIPVLDQSARAVRAIIEFEADMKLFNFGTTAIEDVDLVDTFTKDIFSIIEGSSGYNIDGINLINGHKILVTADTDILANNKIYQVQFVDFLHTTINGQNVSRQIHLAEIAIPELNQVALIHQGTKNQGMMYWYSGNEWKIAQQKTVLNQSPLFDVVDDNLISYGDVNTYIGSTFVGTKLFSYKIGSGTPDTALGFPLSYKNINNIGDIVFNFNLINDTFRYKSLTNVIDQSINVGYLSKLDYAGTTKYVNGWQKNIIEQTQAAVRIYKSTNKINNFDIDIFDNVTDLSDLIVKIYINGIRLSNDQWTIVTGPVFKTVVLNIDITISDVLTIRAFSAQSINKNGYYEIPNNLQNNPLNGELVDFTLGEVIDHVMTIVDNITSFVGSFPGIGNLRDLGNVTPYGTRFVQHSGPLSLPMYHITSETNNIVRAIEKSRDDYNSFKRNFVKISETLGIDTDPVAHVNLILQEINKNTPNTFPYYFSDMVPCGAHVTTELTVVDYRIKTYPLSSVFTLNTLSNKAVLIYVNDNQLLFGCDYTFNDIGYVEISATLANDDRITICEYDNTDGCFVPETPTKMGIWQKYEPMIYTDTSLVTPRLMIQGHDGSQLLAYGDYRDALILELEKRIFNNIKVKYDATIFDIHSIIPSYNRKTMYDVREFNDVLAPNFYKWTSLIDKDFTKALSYDKTNSFTFNYRGHSAPDGRETPGYWRGVYRWILDTDRPNICPWEMLGLSEKPNWWESLYGPAPYTSNNLVLWKDISEGLLREPGKPPIRLTKFAKPFLLNHIPVDENGDLVSPLFSDLSNGIITESIAGDFVFGDISPVEAAWRRSSHYPFSVLLASLLLMPAKTFGVLLDRSRITRNMAGQLVYSDTKLRVVPRDIKLPSIQSSTTRTQTAGIINYIINYILSDNLKSYTEYQYDLTNVKVKISHRLGAFTSKEKFNLILDSRTPLSVGSVFVPPENYDIILNSSSPVKKITYSGVIITKMTDGYLIKGYSKTRPYFNYYPWEQSGMTINVGGISESFNLWTNNQYYAVGKIVIYSSNYYRVKTNHTTTAEFKLEYYQILPSLPIIGGKDAIIRKRWDRTDPITVPYNTKFRTIQEVVDFLVGYGEYLKDQGFIFDDFNNNMTQVTNWETSAKEFLFWTTQNWSAGQDKWEEWLPENTIIYESIVRYNGDYYRAIRTSVATDIFNENDFVKLDGLSEIGSSVISLSPAADKLTFKAPFCVVDDIKNPFNGYEIFKVDGQPIHYNFLNSYREENAVSYTPVGDDGIYGASFYLVQKEQVLIIDNTTLFNDTIYNPESGYKQDRIKVSGYTSTNWYGAFDVPGFVFDQAFIQSWNSWTDYALGDIIKYKEFYYSASKFLSGNESFESVNWIKLDKKPTVQLLPNWNYKASQFEDFYSLDSDNFDSNQQKMAQHLIGYQKRQYLENIIQDDVSEFKFYQGMIIEKGTQNVLNKLFDVLSADGEESLKFHEEWALRVGQYGASHAYENIEFLLDSKVFKNNPQGFELVDFIDPTVNDFISRQIPADIYLKPIGYNSKPWPMLKNDVSFLRTAGYVRADDVLLSLKTIDDILTQDIANFTNGDYVWCTFDTNGWNVYRYTDANIKVIDITYAGTTMTITTDSLISFVVGSYIGIRQVTGFDGFYKVSSVTLNVFEVEAIDLLIPSPFIEQPTIIIYKFTIQRAAKMDDIDSILPTLFKENEMIWTDNSGSGSWAAWEYNPVYIQDNVINSMPMANLEYGKLTQINAKANLLAISTSISEVLIYDKAGTNNPWIGRQTIEIPYTNMILAMSADDRWLVTGSPLETNGQGIISLYEKDINNIYTLVRNISSPVPTDNELFGSTAVFGNNAIYVGATSGNGTIYKLEYSATIKTSSNYDPNTSIGKVLHLSSVADIEIGMIVSGTGISSGQKVTNVNIDRNVVEMVNSTITGTTLTVGGDSALEISRFIRIGDLLSGQGIQTNTQIIAKIGNETATTWEVSISQSVPSTTIIRETIGQSVTLDYEPDSQPTGVLTFSIIEWKYDLTKTKHGDIANSNYGGMLSISDDGSTLLTATIGHFGVYNEPIVPTDPLVFIEPVVFGKVFVYRNDVSLPIIIGQSPYFGKGISVSSTGTYIVISDILTDGVKTNQGSVNVYNLSNNAYSLYQTLNIKNPEVCGYFGSNVLFTNDYKTLLVYSKNADTQLEWQLDDNTTFDDNTTRFLLENNLDSGRIDVYNQYDSKWVFSESLLMTDEENDSYGYSISVGGNSIIVSAPYANDGTLKSGLVFEYVKKDGMYSWITRHVGITTPDVNKIKQAFLYNKSTNKLITYLDVIDPLHGKIPGIADEELKYKVYYDPAIYTIANTGMNIDDGMAWKKAQVGSLWWDLRTAKFVNSNDEDIVYRNSNWSTLATGASIDIYEWVETIYLPSEWDSFADTDEGLTLDISGTSLYGDTAYSISRRYDTVGKTFKNTYYFWVRNKKTVPAIPGRNISAVDVSYLIGNPRSDGYRYLALTGANSFSLTNVSSLMVDQDVVLSVEYWVVENTKQNIHSQWKILSADLNTQLPYRIEQKWIDSLCGKDSQNREVPDINLPLKLRYGIEFRPRQGMFVNRFESLKQYVEQANLILKQNLIAETRNLTNLDSYEAEPSIIRGLYDAVMDTDAELRFASIGSYVRPSLTPVITDGRIVGINIINSGSGYINAPFIEVAGSGKGAEIRAIINTSGKITGATIINSGEAYTDYTSLVVRDYSVLVHSDMPSSGTWSIYSYDPINKVWSRIHSQTYNTTNYWNYIDWYATGYNQFSAITNSVETYADLNSINCNIGELVKIRMTNYGTWVLLRKYSDIQSIDWTHIYEVVGSQNGTIQLSSSLYQFDNSGVGYDNLLYDGGNYDNGAVIELRNILTAMKDDILIDELKSEYLNLFFTSVRYALSEQLYVDWIFKTSFVKATHNVGTLHQAVTYKNDNLTNFEEYVSEVTPYRTKVREYISCYNKIETNETSITDFDLPQVYNEGKLELIDTKVVNEELIIDNAAIQTYPWKHWLDNVGFSITSLTIIDNGFDYVSEPIVVIASKSGTGAKARAFISNGKVNRIVLLSAGTGYLSAPTITIEGGLTTTGIAARAIAIIGNSVIKSSLIKMKFDRITQTYFITQLQETDTLIGTGSRLQFPLTWGPDVRVDTSTVFIDGISALRDNYKLRIVKSTVKGYTAYSGSIIFDTAPEVNAKIKVTYLKDWSLLNAADRIQFYYNPQTGDLGKDLSQLMTGIDYGGVIVSGLGFDVSRGWDSTPYFSDKWDTSDPTFDDFSVTVSAGTNTFILPYIPTIGTLINVYQNNTAIDSVILRNTWAGFDEATTTVEFSQPNKTNGTLAEGVATIINGNLISILITVAGSGYITTPTVTIADTSSTLKLYGTAEVVLSPPVRIDDPAYNTPLQTNKHAVMETWEADGLSSTIFIPNAFVFDGDQFIFRKTTSDGSIKPQEQDYDTALSGGNLAYSTATGLSADDIIIDGDGFVTPTSSSAPEEVVPGQIVDSLAIKIYERPSSGSAEINVDHYIADGIQVSFTITKPINSINAVLVKIITGTTSQIAMIDIDFVIDYKTNILTFVQAPIDKALVSIFGIGSSGNNILDIAHLFGDGITNKFITKAPWIADVTSVVFVNGVELPYELIEINGFIGVSVVNPPSVGDIINYTIVKGSTQTFSLNQIERLIINGNSANLTYAVGESLPYESNMIVRVDQRILAAPINSYFTISNNRLTYVIDATRVAPYESDVNHIQVFADGNLLSIGSDYSVDLSIISVKLTKKTYSKYSGKELVVSMNDNNEYWYIPKTASSSAQILFKDVYDNRYSSQIIEVSSSYNHTSLDIRRTTINAKEISNLVPNSPNYYYYKNILGGTIQLDRTVINESYVWVIKNGFILEPGIDYNLNDDKSSITLTKQSLLTDEFTIITYGNNIAEPAVSYMQFKDMLNRTHFKRLSLHKQTMLVNPLKWNDVSITVVDASNFDVPNPLLNKPGIIEICGERIEYFELVGNVLSKLRRGTLGTGTAEIYVAGTYVQDIGVSETIPYVDTIETIQISSDGSNILPINFVPTKSTTWEYTKDSSIPSGYGQTDDIEVFVGGYDNEISWAPNVSYTADTIVIVGSYTYRCKTDHTSSTTFKLDNLEHWDFFIGNIRLKKTPYAVHNVNVNPDSPSGDKKFDADFSVDGISAEIRLTNKLLSGTRITIVKRKGIAWDNTVGIRNETSKIASFITAQPGIWYSSMQ